MCIIVSCLFSGMRRAFCDVLHAPQVHDDPRFAANADRVANRVALHEVLDPILATRSSEDWTDRFLARDVMAAPVATSADVTASEGYRADRVEVRARHPVAGEVRTTGWAFETSAPEQMAAPELGQHSREAMALMQFTQEELDSLIRSGVVIEGRS